MDAWAKAAKNKALVVVCGPTATGKSSLALHLARRFSGEIISADSMQVYKGLPIGTAALTAEEAGGVPVHLSEFLPPQQAYSVADWLAAANSTVTALQQQATLPVVCGGTGLYIQSLVNGTRFTAQKPDVALRQELEAQWERQGPEEMHRRLAALDPAQAEKLAIHDKKRVLRALELSRLTGQTAAERATASRPQAPPYQSLILGVCHSTRELLYEAINQRVDAMLEKGLLAEAETVWAQRHSYQTAAQAIGYKELFPYFEGQQPLEECVLRLKQATRNYAKRQLTWFRRMPGVHWLPAEDAAVAQRAEAQVLAFCEKMLPPSQV